MDDENRIHRALSEIRDEMRLQVDRLKSNIDQLLHDTADQPSFEFEEELKAIHIALERFQTTIHAILSSAGIESDTIDLDVFTSDVFHDIRSPLNPIIGYSALILFESGDKEPDTVTDNMTEVNNGGKALLELVKVLEKTVSGDNESSL